MQRAGRKLLALSARLQLAASGGGGRAACSQQQQLLSLRSWAASGSSASTVQCTAQATATTGAAARSRPPAAAALRCSFASDSSAAASPPVARPGPAPRGTSKAGSGRSHWSGLFLLAPGGLAAFLGKWQWDRREWKRELLERREREMRAAPLDLFAADEAPPEYSPVWVEGRFDHGASLYIGPRTRQIAGNSKQGFLLMTPLKQEGSPRAVLVNRGWVPAEWREDASMRAAGEPAGKVRVAGILRHGEDPGTFVPPNEVARGNWFYINVPELAAAAGLPPGAPLVEVVTEEPGSYLGRGPLTPTEVLGGMRTMPQVEESYPLPKSLADLMQFSVMPRDHLNYAATWWTLSAATLALAGKAIRQGVKAR